MQTTQPARVADIQQALRLHQAGRLDTAEAIYRELLRYDPANADALHLLGVIAQQQSRGAEAEILVRKAIRINDTDPYYHNNLGEILRQQGRFAEALQCFDRAIALRPDCSEAKSSRSDLLNLMTETNTSAECTMATDSVAADPCHFASSSPTVDPKVDVESMPLIMDIGMNNGRDSLFYLRKGFRVVAVEANPLLVDKVRNELHDYIASGQLIIEPIGLGRNNGQFSFYMNLDNDHWSSFSKEWGTRQGTRYEELSIECIMPQQLFEKYGMPYYIKIDVEGSDIDVVRALHDFKDRPRYISIEEHEAHYFSDLWSIGCRAFKLVDQRNLTQVKCPNPPLEGRYVDAAFDGTTSGPFGDEAHGEWMKFDRAMEKYLTEIRSPTRGYLGGHSWFDIHGRFD